MKNRKASLFPNTVKLYSTFSIVVSTSVVFMIAMSSLPPLTISNKSWAKVLKTRHPSGCVAAFFLDTPSTRTRTRSRRQFHHTEPVPFSKPTHHRLYSTTLSNPKVSTPTTPTKNDTNACQHCGMEFPSRNAVFRHIRTVNECTALRNNETAFEPWTYEDRDFFKYEIIYESKISNARVGRIHTPHGVIDTPGFVPVATNGALKGVDFRDADACGSQLIFCNTYHLMLHPGSQIIRDAGGIHTFANRPNRPFITDSGGFQVFSLAYGSVQEELSNKGELKRSSKKQKYRNNDFNGTNAVKVTENGVRFRSYRDGTDFLMTPESTVQAQKDIGADIIIPLDELPPYHIDDEKLKESVDRSHRWEARSLREHLKNVKNQAMYCVVHGGLDKELRTKSVEYLTSLPFDGYSIGGSLGSNRGQLKDLLSWLMPLFYNNKDDRIKKKPRHLLGIADEESIRNAVVEGIDTLDSCYPTRIGRHGTILVTKSETTDDNETSDDSTTSNNSNGVIQNDGFSSGSKKLSTIKIKSNKYSRSYGVPLDEGCTCSTCSHYDRAYIWHLFKANEPLATQLATIHNLHYMNNLMKGIRNDILNDKI